MVIDNFEKLKQEFSEKLKSLAHNRRRHEVFSDWAEISALALHQAPYNDGFRVKDDKYRQLEERYLGFVSKYQREGLNIIAQMFGVVQLSLAYSKRDFVGRLYEELEMDSQKAKQSGGIFFTPYPVAKSMAQMTLEANSLEQTIAQQGFVSISDPACGAGGMLIAAVETLEELGFDPQEVLYFEATDIDRLCFHMAYIQLSLLGIPGRVIHGNSLSQETWAIWETPRLQVIGAIRGQVELEEEESGDEDSKPTPLLEGVVESEEDIPPPLPSSPKSSPMVVLGQLELFSDSGDSTEG